MREMTQQELADRVGVTRQTVIAIEQDKYSPSLETAFKVAIVLGCRSSSASSTTLTVSVRQSVCRGDGR